MAKLDRSRKVKTLSTVLDTQQLSELSTPVFRVQLVREPSARMDGRASLDGPIDAAGLLQRYLELEDREHFVTLMLDVKNKLIGIHTVSIGTLNAAIISPREVFKAAIIANACSIILGHNHPSGDVTPSPEDLQVTETLKKAGAILDIEVLDHIIVGGPGNFKSLKHARLGF